MSKQLETIVLIHGAWHGAWCWEDVVPILKGSYGFEVLTPELAIDNPAIDVEDHATYIDNYIGDRHDVVIVPHSRGADAATHFAKLHPEKVAKIIYLAGGVQLASDQTSLEASEPAKNSQAYIDAIKPAPRGLTKLDPEQVIDFFYHDCPPAKAQAAIDRLRYQNRNDGSSQLVSQPNVASAYIVCTQDRVINPLWQDFAARKILQAEEIETMDCGHSPFIAHPKDLSKQLATLSRSACDQTVSTVVH